MAISPVDRRLIQEDRVISETTLLLVRHAATDLNLRRPFILQGQGLDPPLAELGRRQAAAVAEALKVWKPDLIYSSPMRRAVETAHAIADATGIEKIDTVAAVTECSIGDWEGLSWDEVAARWPEEHARFMAEPGMVPYPNGESFAMVRDRSKPALEEIAARHPGKMIVAVCHNIVNRAVLADWMGIPQQYARPLPQDNTGYNRIVFRDGKAHVKTINEARHLSGLGSPP